LLLQRRHLLLLLGNACLEGLLGTALAVGGAVELDAGVLQILQKDVVERLVGVDHDTVHDGGAIAVQVVVDQGGGDPLDPFAANGFGVLRLHQLFSLIEHPGTEGKLATGIEGDSGLQRPEQVVAFTLRVDAAGFERKLGRGTIVTAGEPLVVTVETLLAGECLATAQCEQPTRQRQCPEPGSEVSHRELHVSLKPKSSGRKVDTGNFGMFWRNLAGMQNGLNLFLG